MLDIYFKMLQTYFEKKYKLLIIFSLGNGYMGYFIKYLLLN